MPGRDGTAVEARIRRLDDDDLASFVADLWRARDYETEREGDVVVATRGGSRVTVAPLARSRPRPGGRTAPDGGVDVVVAPDGVGGVDVPDDARVLDAVALREMLWYALDPRDRVRLCRRHFGAAPSEVPLPWTGRIAARLRDTREGGPSVSVGPAVSPVLVASAVVLVGIGVITTGSLAAGLFAGGVFASDATGTDGTDGTAAVATPATLPTGTEPGTPTTLPPPGVSRTGIANLTALASAHDRALANLSYAVWIDASRPRSANGSPRLLDVDVAVADDRYLAKTNRGPDGDRQRFATVYFDGSDWYVARYAAATTAYERVPGNGTEPLSVPGPFVLRGSLVERYLSTPNTAVSGTTERDGRRLYRVTGNGTPAAPALAGAANYTVTALVDGLGVVHDLSVAYDDTTAPGSPRVRFEVTYGEFGSATVRVPAWYDERFGVDADAGVALGETPADSTPTPAEARNGTATRTE